VDPVVVVALAHGAWLGPPLGPSTSSIGLSGWLDTSFPTWVYTAALLPAALLAALCLRSLRQTRATLRHRLPELTVYATIAAACC
jgi:hypothetical protein